MVLSSIISDIRKARIGRKSRFFVPLAFNAPVRGVSVRILSYLLVCKNYNGVAARQCKKFDNTYNCFGVWQDRHLVCHCSYFRLFCNCWCYINLLLCVYHIMMSRSIYESRTLHAPWWWLSQLNTITQTSPMRLFIYVHIDCGHLRCKSNSLLWLQFQSIRPIVRCMVMFRFRYHITVP